jgi:hypothetical protein
MKTNASIGLLILFLLIAITLSALEIRYVQGPVATVIFIAACITAFFFSVLERRRGVRMANGDDEQVIEVSAGGGLLKARASGKRLVSAENLLIVIFFMQLGQAWFTYQHFLDAQRSNAEVTYILSLTSEEKAKLNLAMPESLRNRQRNGP